MPARTGTQYLQGLKEHPPEVWIGGEQVKDVTAHPAFKNGAHSLAGLYDMQYDPSLQEEMTYPSPTTGDLVGLSFILPQSIHDLEKRRRMMTHWARACCGMMARTPDFLNVVVTAWGGAGDYFAKNRPEFKQNVQNYYEYVREGDLALTHTLLNFQRSRTPGLIDNLTDQIALTAIKETDSGMIVHGSRLLATLGPISDEIAIYPTRTHMVGEDAWRQTISFAVPCDTPGLKFLCRESLDYGRSHFDHPLGSRFEEMDCIVFFDNVLVPWDRIFLLGDVEMSNNYPTGTGYTTHTGHQVITRNIVKAEFILGLAGLMINTLGSGDLPHVQQRVAELIVYLEVLRACLRAAEADAKPNQWGVMSPAGAPLVAARTLFADTMYPRMAEIIQLLGSSSLMALPSESDFASALGPTISQHLATDTTTAVNRSKLFHLAWDVACSSFGGRQVLYERFFAGDPVRNAMLLYNSYDKEPMMKRVQEFLEWDN